MSSNSNAVESNTAYSCTPTTTPACSSGPPLAPSTSASSQAPLLLNLLPWTT